MAQRAHIVKKKATRSPRAKLSTATAEIRGHRDYLTVDEVAFERAPGEGWSEKTVRAYVGDENSFADRNSLIDEIVRLDRALWAMKSIIVFQRQKLRQVEIVTSEPSESEPEST